MYIPKNKVKTNLHTNGGELIIKSTGEKYIGKYYKLYNGKMFSGENQNTLNTQELIKLSSPLNTFTSVSSIKNLEKNQVSTLNSIDNRFIGDLNNTYSNLKLIDSNNTIKKYPTPYYPQPTENDYKLGEFQRYFCVKSNELIYTEVTKEQYEKFKNKDESVAWQYYTAFTLPWDITGNKEEVYKVNRNIVLITEQNIKRRGLQEFLRENYLKFCKENSSQTTTQVSTQTTPPPPSPTRGTSSY